ncbi:TetR/AcrR family transcriptional regulator [Williamsia sp. D3]|uniref:TetR/AcrR family transcriptional regulator n=1 Tax=Williamsia sp. D3 TaxID=1313067 RepID=UPI0004CDDEA6|nr:TetR/AcrR family transcriptional regulator [Williamsia sp. D3]
MTEPGMVRPGGRTAAVRASVLRATGDVLAESGLPGLDLTDLASRAGVGKTTVYRRWGSAPGLVADLLSEMAAESVPRADTGTLSADLHANAALVRKTLSDKRQGPLFKAIIAAATCDARTADALAHFYDTRVAEWAPCVLDGIARGEAPAGTDAAAAIRQVSAPLYYQFLTSTRPLKKVDAERAAESALAAIAAGVLVSGR